MRCVTFVTHGSKVTFLIYLNDMPAGEGGGGTAFPDLKLEVAPEQGSAVVFNDCFDNGHEDGRTLHAGQPPGNPNTVKMAINVRRVVKSGSRALTPPDTTADGPHADRPTG